MSYVLQYGIADFFKEELIYDVKCVPCTFMFDETTTQKIDKQYVGYLRYWSPRDGQITNIYCGSLFVGHCTHFCEFQTNLGLNVEYLLHFGMDGPHVNKTFTTTLVTELADEGKMFLGTGTYSLHPVHTAFRYGIKELSFDSDEFFNDVHFFFKKCKGKLKANPDFRCGRCLGNACPIDSRPCTE